MNASAKTRGKNQGKSTPVFIVKKVEKKDLDVNMTDFSISISGDAEKEIKKAECDDDVIIIEDENQNSPKSNYPLNYNNIKKNQEPSKYILLILNKINYSKSQYE